MPELLTKISKGIGRKIAANYNQGENNYLFDNLCFATSLTKSQQSY